MIPADLMNQFTLTLPLYLQLAGLFIAVSFDRYMAKRDKALMYLIIFLAASLVLQNIREEYLCRHIEMVQIRTWTAVYGYLVRPMILMLYCLIVCPQGPHYIAWGLIGVNTVIYLISPMTRLAFWIDETNHFHQGPLGYTCYIISGILLGYLLTLTILERRQHRQSNLWVPVTVTVMIVFCTMLDFFVVYENQIVAFLTIGIVNGSVFFYIWLHLKFVMRHRHAVETEQRIRIMISQIQPHFMYNTLAAIQALCYTEPEKAAAMVEKFACYLRQNLDSLEEQSLIPLRKELEHTRIYAEIEMGMYPSVHLEEDIGDDQVMLPALTIQPLVENAIRHGLRGKENGTVRVVVRKEGEDHVIRIEDNGTGFDPKQKMGDDRDRSHIGIGNVRERLQTLCGGEMRIDSVIGEGTTVTIRIPAQKQNEKGLGRLQNKIANGMRKENEGYLRG